MKACPSTTLRFQTFKRWNKTTQNTLKVIKYVFSKRFLKNCINRLPVIKVGFLEMFLKTFLHQKNIQRKKSL